MNNEDFKSELRTLMFRNAPLDSRARELLQDAANYIGNLEELHADQRRLAKELDVALNGENAAEQASLCDLVSQAKSGDPRQPIGYIPAYILQRAKMGRASPIEVALSLTQTDDNQLAIYCGPAGEDVQVQHLHDLIDRVLTAAGEDWQDVDELPEVVRKLRNADGKTPSKSAEPAQNVETIHALALSVERLTRQFEPIITSDRITGLDANALEVLERARDMDWNDDAAPDEPTTAREWIVQAMEYVSHCALGHDVGHLVHFANKAEAAMRQALELLQAEAIPVAYTSHAQLNKYPNEQKEAYGIESEKFSVPLYTRPAGGAA